MELLFSILYLHIMLTHNYNLSDATISRLDILSISYICDKAVLVPVLITSPAIAILSHIYIIWVHVSLIPYRQHILMKEFRSSQVHFPALVLVFFLVMFQLLLAFFTVLLMLIKH